MLPNEGIRRSVRHGVIGGLLAWLVVAALGEVIGVGYSDAIGEVAIGLAIGWTAGLIDAAADPALGNRRSRGQAVRGGLLIGLAGGLTAGVIGGPIGGLVYGLVSGRATSNQGIRRLADGPVIAGLLGGIMGAFLALPFLLEVSGRSFTPLAAIFVGMIAWLHFGGRAALRNLLLRILLTMERAAPWRFVHFLDDATQRLYAVKNPSLPVVAANTCRCPTLLTAPQRSRHSRAGPGRHPCCTPACWVISQ